MPGRPCIPEAGAANDLARAHVAGHGHRFRLGVDQPGYLRLLRFFASMLGHAALHPSVTRRAASYESHPSWVSIQPQSRRQRRPIPARVASFRGPNPSARFGSGASPRMPCQTVRRCPSGMCRPVCRTGVSASPCSDADGSLAGKSTGRKRPIVSGRFRMCQRVSEPSDAAASGWSSAPGRGFLRFSVGQIAACVPGTANLLNLIESQSLPM